MAAENLEEQINQEVQRRVGSQMRRHNEEVVELRNQIRDLSTQLVQHHSTLKRLLGEPLTFGTLLKVHNTVDPRCFKTNDPVIVCDDQSEYFRQKGVIVSGINGRPVIDDLGFCTVRINDEEIQMSVGVQDRLEAQVRLSEKDDGTFAVVSIDGKPWEVKGIPDLSLNVGDSVKIKPDTKAIVCRGYDMTAGPICHVISVTDKGVEVQAKSDKVIVNNPRKFELEEGDRVACDHSLFCILQKLERDPRERYKLKNDLTVTWDDVGGLDVPKSELRDALELPFTQPELFEYYGVQPLRGVLLYGAPGCGKAQPLSSIVYTPSGPTKMGYIKVGQDVCTPDGKSAKVLGVFPQGEKDVYEVVFSDGSKTRCCDEHLWDVETRNNYKSGVLNTNYLRQKLKMNDGKRIYSIQTTCPVSFEEKQHKIHPYLMGALLAEGHFGSCVSITVCNPQMLEKIKSVLPDGYSLKSKDENLHPCDYYITRDKTDGHWDCESIITDEIQRFALKGKLAHEKWVPNEYLYDSIENRLELVRGMMDGDGTVTKNGMGCSLSSSSKELAENFRFLIQSLGGTCNICEKETTYIYNGEKLEGKISHRCFVSINNMTQLFSIDHKLDRIIEKTKRHTKRFIESINYVGVEWCQCILIDHPNHLYLTDEFIVTHNTLLARAAASAIAAIHGKESVDTGYIYVKSPEILDKWVGNTEAEIRELFERGRRHYRQHGYKGILAFDEADAIMPQRGTRRSSDISDTIVPMFLGEMDGIDEQQTKENPIVILMTNRADILDPAITRPGRISKHIKVERPTEMTAIDILQIHTRKMPFKDDNNKMAVMAVAISDLFSRSRILYRVNNEHDVTLGDCANGAMLAALAESAKMIALHRDLGNGAKTGVIVDDFRESVKKLYRDQRGLNHSFDLHDFAENHGLQADKIQVERCFGAA